MYQMLNENNTTKQLQIIAIILYVHIGVRKKYGGTYAHKKYKKRSYFKPF